MATTKQRVFIARLKDEREMTVGQRERLAATMAGSVDADQASAIIDWLMRQPTREGYEPLDLSGLRSGRYAVTTDSEMVLFKVDVPEAGQWAGFVFVKNGSEYADERFGMQKPDQGYRGDHETLLRQVVDDPEAALAEYGRVTDHCGLCGKKLEDPESVARGIGPVCIKKLVAA